MNKEKIKNWFKDRDNLILVGILVFATIIRLYYFFLTKNQPLWWDEADYMAYAKTLAGVGETSWIVTSAHNSLLSFFASMFFMINSSEQVIKLFLEIIPSIAIVLFVYLLCKEIYNKKIAVISSFIFAVFWELLFYTFRFHTEVPGLLFAFIATYIFFKGYEKKEKVFGLNSNWAIPLSVVFVLISYGFRRQYLIFGAFFLVYMLLTKKWNVLLKDKYNWVGLVVAIIGLIVLDKTVFINSVGEISNIAYHPEHPIHFAYLGIFYGFFKNFNYQGLSILYYLFILGFIILISKILLAHDLTKKEGNYSIKGDLFFILSIILTLIYFIFYQRYSSGAFGETRWYYPVLLASIICISRATVFIFEKIKKHQKNIALIFILILIFYIGYYQLSNTDTMLKIKLDSYSGIKSAGTYLKEISLGGEKIISVPVPQPAYYSEKVVLNPGELYNKTGNENEEINEFIKSLEQDESLRYLIVSFSEPNHPSWLRRENEEYAYNSAGQIVRVKLEIPLMDTIINFQTGEQIIQQEKTYGNITFRLKTILEDCFVYEIERKN